MQKKIRGGMRFYTAELGPRSDNRSPGREQASERTKSLVASTVLRMVGNAGGQEVFLGSCLFASAHSPMTHGRFSLGHMADVIRVRDNMMLPHFAVFVQDKFKYTQHVHRWRRAWFQLSPLCIKQILLIPPAN